VTTPGWPLFDLRVTTPRVTLRLGREDELLALAERAAGNVLTHAQATFMGAWTQLESPRFEREFMQFHWRLRADWRPDSWELALGVFADGELLGSMDAKTRDFPILRSAVTGSWLLPEARGRGLGREMRAAMVQLLFTLGANEVRSGAHPDNAASLAVSRALGYTDDGTQMMLAGLGEPVEVRRMRLRREAWTPREDIEISGLDSTVFGL
jgi:RimJ/RimL family protein N-acetyltransferase